MAEHAPHKLFFMHIAKTGGSTVNDFLLRQFPPGRMQTHIESTVEWRDDPSALLGFDGLSGHVDLQTLDKRLDLDGYRLVTVLRDPWRQLISHLAWIRRLAEPESAEALAAHPPAIQSLAARLHACDLRDAGSITTMIESLTPEERPYLDNVQVRYFSAMHRVVVSEEDLERARIALDRFDRIGTSERLEHFLDGLSRDMGWPRRPLPGRKNVTNAFFGLDEATDSVRMALEPLFCHDEILYGAVAHEPGGLRGLLSRWKAFGRKG